jgi:hypothetical protein
MPEIPLNRRIPLSVYWYRTIGLSPGSENSCIEINKPNKINDARLSKYKLYVPVLYEKELLRSPCNLNQLLYHSYKNLVRW